MDRVRGAHVTLTASGNHLPDPVAGRAFALVRFAYETSSCNYERPSSVHNLPSNHSGLQDSSNDAVELACAVKVIGNRVIVTWVPYDPNPADRSKRRKM